MLLHVGELPVGIRAGRGDKTRSMGCHPSWSPRLPRWWDCGRNAWLLLMAAWLCVPGE